MDSNADFDHLAGRTAAPDASGADYERLFAAAFALPEWNFVARGELPNVSPHVAIFPGYFDDQPMVAAFTDTARLQRYAKEKNLTSAAGEAMILSIPTASVIAYLEQFIAHGVQGIFFNPDRDSHGFFIPIQQLRPIKDHLDAMNQPAAKACLAVDFTLTLMRLTDSGDYVESGDQVFRYFFIVPDAWKTAQYQQLAWQTAVAVYDAHFRHFRLVAPEDPNYIAVKRTDAKFLTAEEIAAKPWNQTRPPVWEATNCLKVDENGQHAFVSAADFEASF